MTDPVVSGADAQPALAVPAEPASGLVASRFDQAQGTEDGQDSPSFYEYLHRFTEMGKAVHVAAEKLREMKAETDVRARMESALERILAKAQDARWSSHWRCGLGEAATIMREALDGSASVDTRPEGRDAKQARFTSGAVAESETPQSLNAAPASQEAGLIANVRGADVGEGSSK